MSINSLINYNISVFKKNDNKIIKNKDIIDKIPEKPSPDTGFDKFDLSAPERQKYIFAQSACFSEPDEGQMLDKNLQIFNRSQTSYFRSDINWQDFGEYLKEHFETLDNVNIHCFGCSTGQEPYSLALLLKKYFDDTDFTVNASDIVETRIKNNILNQEKGILIDGSAFDRICETLDLETEQAKKYFLTYPNSKTVMINPKVANCVKFSQKNVLKSIDDIDENKKSIIICRNMWPYVNSEKYDEFAEELYDKLSPGSVIVLGSYDYCGEKQYANSDKFPETLIKHGFKPVKRGAHFIHKNTPLIFEK